MAAGAEGRAAAALFPPRGRADPLRVCVVGAGAMGSAFAEGMTSRGVVPPDRLVVSDSDGARAEALAARLGCGVAGASDVCDVLLLAVKPCDLAAAARDAVARLAPGGLVVSCLAGRTVADVRAAVGRDDAVVVRCMPNLPVAAGAGVTALYAPAEVPAAGVRAAVSLLSAAGVVVTVNEERLVDAATAASGSGPGYVAYVIEHMTRGAVALGLTEGDAAVMVTETVAGTVAYLKGSGLSPRELRDRVTSPGGTTAAAVASFDADGVGEGLRRGMAAAYRRAAELAGRRE